MNIVKRNVELVSKQSYEEMIKENELAIRNCYKSEDKITDDSAERMVRMMINSGHGAAIEFANVTFHIVCDRACSHQLVRHRMASYMQTSQRYVNYSKDKFNHSVPFIIPCNLKNYDKWEAFCSDAEETYFDMIEHGDKAEVARSVLPNCVATSIYVRMNMRELRHFLSLRLSNHAQADIRDIATQMYNIVKEKYPVYVENLVVDGIKYGTN